MVNIFAYIPTEQNNNCSIFKLYNQIKYSFFAKSLLKFKWLLIITNEPKLLGYLKNGKISKFSCIGYRDDEYPLIKTVDKTYLSSEWFEVTADLGVFFVKNGDSMFVYDSKWSSKFRSWLTFSDMFEPNIDREDFLDLQTKMYKNIHNELSKTDNSTELKKSLESIYSKYIDLTWEKCRKKGVNQSDMLLVAQHLKGNKNSIING